MSKSINISRKRNRYFLQVLLILLLLFKGGSRAQDIVVASHYGVKANSFENAASAIQKAIDICKTKRKATLLLPGGRIDIWPEGAAKRELYISNTTEDDTLPKVKNIAFLFEHCNDLTIDGNQTLVVLHGKMIAFALINSQNIKLKNIQFDYERPTISELTIRSVTNNAIETEIHPDSKYVIDNGKINFYGEGWKTNSYHCILFDSVNNRMRYSTMKPLLEGKAVQTGPLHVKFEGRFSPNQFQLGNVLTFRDPYRDNCGGFIHRSKDVILENLQMHFMHGLGIVSQFSENISLFKVAVAPRKNSGRIIASFADCFHFSGCKGLVKIDSCFTSGSHDDPVNVHGTHLQITAIDEAKKIKLRFMHHQTYGFEAFFAGDSIAFVNPQTLMPLGTAKLKAAKLINRKEMEIEVEGNIPSYVATGLCIENLSWIPEVIIRNSRFERTNTRGLLITTRRKVLIEQNLFYHTGMFPILIADDASSWFESGSVQDVTIRNNVFEDCGYNSGSGAINIAPENHELMVGNMVHRNIRIIGNQFKLISNTVLSARSVDNLLFADNTFTFSDPSSTQKKIILHLTACKNVKIKKNHAEQTDGLEVNATKMKKNDLKADCKVNLKE